LQALLALILIAQAAAQMASAAPRPSAAEQAPEELSDSDWSVIRAAFEVNRGASRNGRSAAHAVMVGESLSQQAYLKASNPAESDSFGTSVAVSGDTVVVGAYREASNTTGVNGNQTDNSASQSGAAYIFVRDGGGNWSQQAYLKASNTGENDQFGSSVAVSGDTVVVGAWSEDSSATGVNGNQADDSAFDSGAAYVFVRDGDGNWSQQAYLKASNTGIEDFFGRSVAVSGDTIAVGAWSEGSNATGVNGNQANNSAGQSGAAYVFVRNELGNWSQQAYLKASNTGAVDRFGLSVAVSGDIVVVGAYSEDSNATGVNGNQANNSAVNSGAAYIFVRDGGGNWSQQAYLKASQSSVSRQFGYSVAVWGDTVVVGANGKDIHANNNGAAYVFGRDGGGNWSQQAHLYASNPDENDEFGDSVGVSEDTVVVGAPLESSNATGVNGNQADNSATWSGAAYVFVREGGGTWSQQAYLKASNTDAFDNFGNSVAVSSGTVVVGAPGESSSATGTNGNQADNSVNFSGAAYVFMRDAVGTCCISKGSCESEGNCRENVTSAECGDLGGVFLGASVSCVQACLGGECIPTVSEWGLASMTLVILTVGTIILRTKIIAAGRMRLRPGSIDSFL
jgi:hypothetical protein